MAKEEFLIVGLGNPGSKYHNTRHNIGFSVIDHLQKRLGLFAESEKWNALYSPAEFYDKKLHLLKPQTYMNRSGESVARFYRFFKMEAKRLMVIHDDLDMDAGRIKLVCGGGHGGHNGIRSIVSCLGLKDFFRLKIGIGRPGKDGIHPDFPVEKYVLGSFNDSQAAILEKRMDAVAKGLEVFLLEGKNEAMGVLNSLK